MQPFCVIPQISSILVAIGLDRRFFYCFPDIYCKLLKACIGFGALAGPMPGRYPPPSYRGVHVYMWAWACCHYVITSRSAGLGPLKSRALQIAVCTTIDMEARTQNRITHLAESCRPGPSQDEQDTPTRRCGMTGPKLRGLQLQNKTEGRPISAQFITVLLYNILHNNYE